MRRITFLFLVLLPLLVACGSRASLSPTPFPTAAATLTPAGSGPIVLTITELAAAPGLYRDAVVQLTGRLRKQPILVCDTDARPSPASWGLVEEGVLTLAGGFDQQVRLLLPDDLLMTVEGRWRLWEGVVGCGKDARQQEIWYLDVGRLVLPSPLTQVTLTPGAGAEVTAVADLPPTEELVAFPTPNLEETPVAPEPTLTSETSPDATAEPPIGAQSPTPTLPNPEQTPSTTPTLSALTGTPGAGGTSTPSGTLTPTITGTPPTQTPTVTGTPPTSTPTATGGAPGQVVEKGNFYDEMSEEYILTTLASGTIHSWELDIFEDESMFVYVVAPPPADIILSVLKDGQTIVNRQNTAPAGSPEFINAPALQGEGVYELQVIADGGSSTDYAIAFYTDAESPIVLNGIITSGNPRSAVQMPAFASHYWFFVGNAGQVLTIRLTPRAGSDLEFYLYAPDLEVLVDEDNGGDDGGDGEEESIETTLTTSGLYGIRIGELIAETTVTYDLAITLQ